MAYAYGVEYDTKSQVISLPPGKYWLVLGGSSPGESLWSPIKKQIEAAHGKASFRTVQTRESQAENETWVVIEVATPIQIESDGVLSVSAWSPGDNAYSEGEWEQPPPDWISTASDIVRSVEDKASAISRGMQGMAYAGMGLGLVFLLINSRRGAR